MRIDRIGTVAFGLAAMLVAFVGFNSVAPVKAATPTAPRPTPPAYAEPAGAAAFLAAYARGDETAADQLASPLYRAEWERRGLSVSARQSLHAMPAAASGAEWIHFTYLGGAPSDDGTSQLLYEAQPTGPLNRAYPSAWRVDTDQSGNVIWAEMVYLFSTPLSDVAPVRLTSSGGDAAWPTVVAPFHPRLIAGLRSRVGPEAYYEVMLPTGSKDALFDGPFNATVFFAVDSDGNIRPGVWTYGDSTAWSNASPGTESADASTSPLRRTFAATLP